MQHRPYSSSRRRMDYRCATEAAGFSRPSPSRAASSVRRTRRSHLAAVSRPAWVRLAGRRLRAASAPSGGATPHATGRRRTAPGENAAAAGVAASSAAAGTTAAERTEAGEHYTHAHAASLNSLTFFHVFSKINILCRMLQLLNSARHEFLLHDETVCFLRQVSRFFSFSSFFRSWSDVLTIVVLWSVIRHSV